MGEPQATFINSGVMRKLGGSTDPNVQYDNRFRVPQTINTGLIDVQVGTFRLAYAQNSGEIRSAAGTKLWLLDDLESSGVIDVNEVEFHTHTGSFKANRTILYNGSSTVQISGTIE